MKDLKASFQARGSWSNNRSSAIFPFFQSKNTTHYLVFQDYWSWKNEIPKDQIKCIVHLYDSKSGSPAQTEEFAIENHNCINLNKIFESCLLDHQGLWGTYSFEVEIVSTCNLGFPFPGVMLCCVDAKTGEVSCVHSAGRRLNPNEGKYLKSFTETNWLALQNSEFTPFFHVFNDSIECLSDKQRSAEVSIHIDGEAEPEFHTTIELDCTPFASRIFYIKDILPQSAIDYINGKEIWVEVDLKATTFPRMIAGNYDLLHDFHYLTHSFGRVNSLDYIQSRSEGEVSAFLPLMSALPLRLTARSYPTNAPCSINSEIVEYLPNCGEEKSTHESCLFESRGNEINIFENNSTTLRLYKIRGKCPSRLNVSYNYYLPNSRHPTDIATGFKSKDYPPKHSHWGHGVCRKDFLTLIFIRNISHSNDALSSQGSLEVEIELFSGDLSQVISTQIPASGWNFLEINPEEFSNLKEDFFSWRFKDYVSTHMEVFWISYNSNTGSICGEHGF